MKINDNIEITNEDNMALMARYPDNYFDLAVVDPPYGLERFKKGGSHVNKYGTENQKWNNKKPTPEYFTELSRVSKYQIIWGGNNFTLPESEYFIIWQKGNAIDFSFAMVEQAWTNVKKPAKLFKHLHVQNKDKRIHPTQKPVELYEWIFKNYAQKGFKIIDTHLGSGNIAKALDKVNKHDKMNLSLVACEIDKEYFDKSIISIKQETNILTLF